MYQFETPGHLRAWEDSQVRHDLLRRVERISEERRITVPGMNSWFTVTGGSFRQRAKTFLLTWAAAYPTLLVLSLSIQAVAPGLPRPVSLAATSGVLTALLTWLILPRLTRRTRPWLLRGSRPRPAERP
ncbi:hypothetical protein [Streptomyces coryli]|uniref:hypothetical protein n=1 Tax=Streptomyces coryli TaxID=1128680 RepID=UPI0019D072DB|nr:hypothetical protein [Streptomyces coryli]